MSSTADIVKNRFLGLLIWQSIHSTVIFVLVRTLLLAPFVSRSSFFPSLEACLSFIVFHLSLLLFSVSVFLSASPQACRPASLFDLALALLRFLFVPSAAAPAADFCRRAKISLSLLLLVAVSAMSGFLSLVSLCGWLNSDYVFGGAVGLRGLAHGIMYGLYYVFKHRWVLNYPIIQRPIFFSFKVGFPGAVRQALKLSSASYLISAFLVVFLTDRHKGYSTIGKFIGEQIIFYIGSFVVFLCFELSHHLHQVLLTKRFIFAPPKGSAAAETNPSEHLLAALEESTPRSLLHYLAYLDLCMVCERNVDTWRRAAFFEETAETYKRVVAACVRPLEQFVLKLGEGLESCSVDNTWQLSNQLGPPTDSCIESKFYELFNDSQLFAWCARAVASLTAHSHREDRCGVAQLSGSNAVVISTLLSCLLAVETLMGKKTNLQSHQLTGPAGIRWATLNTGRKDATTAIMGKKRGGPLHVKAYALADVMRTTVYCIVSAFHGEMLRNDKARLLEDWIVSSKPLYGTRELLLHKLRLFLDFQAC
ncbi:uncharacterized protein LOC131146567 [Malania oleifera]|uniref:uncharacterized protein LOC131146567 n=1 Tax=Malania oleifera TaxID=397392 RepID=UPI0025AEC145|nr:uncharacterized protein LOC131146567 [Malania oleifera]